MVENCPGNTTTEYLVEFDHTHDEGICDNAVAGPGPQNASLVRLHAPIERLIVFWTASREGAPPDVPSHKSFLTNFNRVFLGGKRSGVITQTLGGIHIFQMCGFFRFSVVAPEGLDSNFPLSKAPWETGLDVVDFMIPSTSFLPTGIVNPGVGLPTGVPISPAVPLLDLQMGIQA